MTRLSNHLTLEEMTRSQTALRLGIDNTPSPDVIARMTKLAEEFFEPVRTLLGVPLHVDSGFRCVTLNEKVGGASSSAHLRGDAIDFIPVGMDLQQAFDAIRRSPLPFDQLIIECGTWIHLGQARSGAMPRRDQLVASGSPGHWSYVAGEPVR
jgi:hypothetical protein